MKILITGVAGFIGSNLAKQLLKLNYKVIGIDNLSYGNLRNIEELKGTNDFKFLFGDIADPQILKDIKCDIIVHLASQKIPRYTNALRTLEENYLMLRNIVNKCVIDKTKILFASTSDVYGKNTKVPFSESSDLVLGQTTIKRWAYALSKIYGEQYIIANNDEHNLQYTIMRFFGSYGPNQNLTWWGGPQSVFIANALEKKPIDIHGNGLQTRTFTYIDDTIQGIVKCIEEEKANNQIFNIASNQSEEISILDLGKMIWKLINGTDSVPLIKFIPYNSFGNYEDVQQRVADISKIMNLLNFKPVFTLKGGLTKTIEWQKKISQI
jgi:UDP-glucose 4-epimerase